MGATALINGVNYSWANVTLILFGVPVVGITNITYKKKQKKDNNYGFGTEPISRGYGNSEYEASITLYQDEWKQIVANAPNGDPTLIPMFNISVVFGGANVTAHKDTLQACEFTEDSLTAAQGDTKLLVTLPLIVGGINHS